MENVIGVAKYATVQIGRRTFAFTSFPEVSAAYRATIDRLGLGASRTPPCLILDGNGAITAHVSYNGRVWEGDFRRQDVAPCIYDPIENPRFPPSAWSVDAARVAA